MIGPLACWLWFEVEHFPMDTRVATGLYADLALYRRIKEGIEAGLGFRNKAHLRGDDGTWAHFERSLVHPFFTPHFGDRIAASHTALS